MWRKILQSSIAVALLAVVVISPLAAVAQEETAEPTTTSEAETSTEDKAAARAERVEKYKAARSEALTNAQTARIKSRCAAAQGKVTSLQARVTTIKENRRVSYEAVLERLDTLLKKLEAADVDTSTASILIADIQTEITATQQMLIEYETALSDIAEMDCAADPAAFSAALATAKTLQTTLREKAAGIKKLIVDNLKPELQAIREALNANTTTEETTTTEGDQ